MYYIGIDLGGTNIKGALVSETGEIAREVSRPTRVELGAEAVCDGIAAVITELSSGIVIIIFNMIITLYKQCDVLNFRIIPIEELCNKC